MSTLPATAQDIDILARTIFGEARGEPFEGQLAVAHVILNRAKIAAEWQLKGRQRPNFGDGSLASACLDAYEFSAWNTTDPTRLRMLSVELSDPKLQTAYCAALMVMTGRVPDPTAGSTHYYADTIEMPNWAKDKKGIPLTPAVIIGNHRFYSGIS